MNSHDNNDAPRLQRRVAQRLESLKGAGVGQLGKARGASSRKRPAADRPAQVPPPSAAPLPPVAAADRSLLEAAGGESPVLAPAERGQALHVLQQEVARCVRCPHLAATRTQTVFGVGNPAPRLCFFGEAPGADEDRQGEPFVGRAGKLLNDILRACKLERSEAYILNVIKCRPPDNRTPAEDEIANCRGYFERQFEILRPEFICCLGLTAAQALLGTTQSLGRLRGRFHLYGSAQVVATYHPAYLLRNPAAKRDTWEDMQMLMRAMGIDLAKK
jgi:uracil-DNA glycosylase family 4